MYRFPIEAWKKNYSDYSSQKRLESSERGKRENNKLCQKYKPRSTSRNCQISQNLLKIDTSRPFVDFSTSRRSEKKMKENELPVYKEKLGRKEWWIEVRKQVKMHFYRTKDIKIHVNNL